MGFDVNRFPNSNDINEELICIICKGVLEDPVWAYHCEHAFCKICIHKWLIRRTTCPNDRQNLQQSHLKPIPRFMRNILDKLQINCDFASFGCEQVFKLESLRQHISDCDFNPEKEIECHSGCGLVIKKADIHSHNCVKDLRKRVHSLTEDNIKFERILNNLRNEMHSLRNDSLRLNELNNSLQNDVKQIKLLVGIKDTLVSEATSVSCITGTQSGGTSMDTPMASSTSVKTPERTSRLVPNPYVLITPLQSSSLRTETILSASDEPSSSTLTVPLSGRLTTDEPAFKRRGALIPNTIPIGPFAPLRTSQTRPYSPPAGYSSPTQSPRFVPNARASPPILSPQSISEDEETPTTITIARNYSSYNYITLDAEQDFVENDQNETEELGSTVASHEEFDFDVHTNEDHI